MLNKFLFPRFFSALRASRSTPPEVVQTGRTKMVDGEPLSADDFVYVGSRNDTSTWALPYGFSDPAKRQRALTNAGRDFLTDPLIPKDCHPEVRLKLVRLFNENGLKVSNSAEPDDYSLQLKRISIERQRCS